LHDKITRKITGLPDKITKRSRQVIENKGSAREKSEKPEMAASRHCGWVPAKEPVVSTKNPKEPAR
jgi:hypothetical protein